MSFCRRQKKKAGLKRSISDNPLERILTVVGKRSGGKIMGHAPAGCAWMTVQGHQNIVAVAVLREMAAIIITGGQKPHEETIQKADQEGIPILLWADSSFSLAGRIFSAGVGNLATE
jgi:ribosomal protein L32E